ncbi:hypothetical protein [Thalassoroseus pseudoceratinae]|uniref:hypothetical protein n=1 Tax=Thalassoroseus pseudoceratinae TaxID=2713176 RepID=UPI00141EFC12|nr:hypothetical protein [Thalassoroseus pseudoceratinae]
MPVKIRCPECEKGLTLPDKTRGRVIRCPACGGKVNVPGGGAKKSSGPRRKRSGASSPSGGGGGDVEDVLARMDLSRVEDANTRICPKCGAEADEDDIECDKCGVDLETGQLSARKKKLKKRGGPDPARYFSKGVPDAWNFLLEHKKVAFRTMIYHVICGLLGLLSLFMVLYCSRGPLKAFWVLVTCTFLPVIPGWLWLLHTEIIQFTHDTRRKVWKHPRFDFFLSAANGFKFVGWILIGGFPIIIGPLIYGIMQINDLQLINGLGIILLGCVPLIPFFPIAMSHFAMPQEWPGWCFWKTMPPFFTKGVAKPAMHWAMFFVLTMLPAILMMTVLILNFGEGLTTIIDEVEMNARRGAVEIFEEPKTGGDSEDGPAMPLSYKSKSPKGFWFDTGEGEMIAMKAFLTSEGENAYTEIDYKQLLGPLAMILGAIALMGIPALFLMRLNGWLTYYYQPDLDLITQEKETKWEGPSVKDPHAPDAEDDDNNTTKIVGGVVGLIVFYVIVNVISYFFDGPVFMPRPLARLLNLMQE